MPHPLHKVTSFKKLAPYTLCIRFADNTAQTIDFRPLLAGALYGPRQDVVVFAQVRLDPEVSTLVWPNGADFDPAVLHDWPAHQAAFVSRARQWATTGIEVRERERDQSQGDVR